MAKRRRTDNIMAKRRRTDNKMANCRQRNTNNPIKRRTLLQTTVDKETQTTQSREGPSYKQL
jgi:hypothetical protein